MKKTTYITPEIEVFQVEIENVMRMSGNGPLVGNDNVQNPTTDSDITGVITGDEEEPQN